MRDARAEKDTDTHDDRRNQHHRQCRRRCGTGRARRAGEGPRQEGRRPEEGRALRPRKPPTVPSTEPKSMPRRRRQPRQREDQQEGCQGRPQVRRPACREQGREDPGDDRPHKGCYPCRDHEEHPLAGAQRPGIHLDKIESAKRDAGERTYKIAKWCLPSRKPLVQTRRLFSFDSSSFSMKGFPGEVPES